MILPQNEWVGYSSRTDENIRPGHPQLEATVIALEKERVGLVAHLKARVLSSEQIQTIQDFAAKVMENLESMQDDFEMKRRLVEELDVCVTLTVEDGRKVIYARCLLGEGICLTSRTIHGIVAPP